MTKIINMNSEQPEDITKVYQDEKWRMINEEDMYEGKTTNGGLIIPIMLVAFITLVVFLMWVFGKI